MSKEVQTDKKSLDNRPLSRATISADRPVDVLKTLEHLEAQAGRLQKMAREVRIALTTK